MPQLTNEQMIKEYFEEVKDKYPGIDYQHFFKICRAPFDFVKKCIGSGELPKINIRYIGKFKIYKKTILSQMELETKLYSKGIGDKDIFENNMKFYDQYIRLLDNEKEENDIIKKTRKDNKKS